MKRRAIHFIAAFAAVLYAIYVYLLITGTISSVVKSTGDTLFDLGQQIGKQIASEFFRSFQIYAVAAAVSSLLFLALKWHFAMLLPAGCLIYGWFQPPPIVDPTSKLLLPMWPVILLLVIAAFVPNKKAVASSEVSTPAVEAKSAPSEPKEDPFEVLLGKKANK